jgi:hypothetical protein
VHLKSEPRSRINPAKPLNCTIVHRPKQDPLPSYPWQQFKTRIPHKSRLRYSRGEYCPRFSAHAPQ